jgi:hypothetical protein
MIWARRALGPIDAFWLVCQVATLALMGTLVGVFTIVIGVGPRTVPDVAYPVLIVTVLMSGLVVAARASKVAP